MKPVRNIRIAYSDAVSKITMDTNISSGLNKNIIIGIIALLIITGAAFVIVQTRYSVPAPAAKIDGAEIGKKLSELNALDSDMALFGQDDAVSGELNNAVNEVGEISAATALSDDERGLNNFSNDLTDIFGDEAVSKELDQTLGEAVL